MGTFVKGDVVVVPFPFSDLSAAKRRPALVVAILTGDDVILCQITSRAITDSYAIPITDMILQLGNSARTVMCVRTACSLQIRTSFFTGSVH
jgi:mRNA interferase MazF